MINLEEITMSEFKKGLRETKTIVFPFGTLEEHGSHLPLSTDSLVIMEALKLVGKKKKFFRAPIVHYGVCTTTKNHPGTISISPKTLRLLSRDLIIEAYKKGLQNFILVSGHGGGLHMSAMKETAEILIEELKNIKIAVFTPYDLLWKELGEIAETANDSHAGEIETSLVLYCAPHLAKGKAAEEYPKIPKALVVKDKLKHWPGGVWGNPEKASPEKGKKALKLMADSITEVIERVEKYKG